MKSLFSLNSFSARLWLGFLALIFLTTLGAGMPAFWMARTQVENQVWLQVDNAQRVTQSLLEAERDRVTNQLMLFTERPTLQRLVREQSLPELDRYLQDFRSQSELDLLFLCADGLLAAGGGDYADCMSGDTQGYIVLNGRPAILVQRAVTDQISGQTIGTAVAGMWLEEPFLQHLAATTGTQQSILDQAGTRLSSSFATAGSSASIEVGLADGQPGRQSIPIGDSVYYTMRMPLENRNGQAMLFSEVALQIDDLLATEKRAFSILAVSTASVVLLGSLLSVWILSQINAPLRELTETAEQISQGNLMAPIPLFPNPVEIRTLAAALHRSQASMLEALHERSELGERLNTLLQSIVEGVVTYDNAGRATFWSEGASHLLEWSVEEAEGRTINELFPLTEDNETQFLDHISPAGQKKQINVLTRSGRPVVLAVTSSALVSPGSDVMQVALVFRDVTEEEAVHLLRSYFLANISHEFRTPLSAIAASMELLLDEREDLSLAEVRQLLKPMHVSALSLQTLIDNLLESSSIEAGQFRLRLQLFDIHEAIENAVNIARPLLERRNQPLSLAEPPQLPPVEADPTRLTQALVNLISNASKYSPIGQPIELQLERQADTLYVAVADRGPGIPPDERSNLFRRFVRLGTGDREQYGIGLGLFVVKTIVEAHGGRVGISDRPGGGLLFWFEIPLSQGEAPDEDSRR